ncbi:MAG: hypothetical protein KDB02_08875 [Acidimicrobiales bacterium]|nr:hypothetical protein [Acidimicrobiales bacterium]
MPTKGPCRNVAPAIVRKALGTGTVKVEASGSTCLVSLSGEGSARVTVRSDVPPGALDLVFDGPSEAIADRVGDSSVSDVQVALDVRAAVRRGGSTVVVDLSMPGAASAVQQKRALTLARDVAVRLPKSPPVKASGTDAWCDRLAKATNLSDLLDTGRATVDDNPISGGCSIQTAMATIEIIRIQAAGAGTAALDAAGGEGSKSAEVASGARYVEGHPDATITGTLYVLDGKSLYQVTGTGPLGTSHFLVGVAKAAAGR